MQHAQKAATETKAQGGGGLGFKDQGSVVQLEFFQAIPQIFKVIIIQRENTGKYHGFDILKPLNGLGTASFFEGDGIPYLNFLGNFNTGDDIPHIACFQGLGRDIFQLHHSDLVGRIDIPGINKADLFSFFQASVHYPYVGDHAPERVEDGVKYQGLKRSFGITAGSGNTIHDGRQDIFYSLTRFPTGQDNIFFRATDQIDHLVGHLFDDGRIHIHLVQHRNDLQIVFNGEIQIGNGLGLYALGGIYQQQRTFTGSD